MRWGAIDAQGTWATTTYGIAGLNIAGMVVCGRVEALVGNADVSAAALGCDHTLFLDRQGAVWSCGENKEVGRRCHAHIRTDFRPAVAQRHLLPRHLWLLISRGYLEEKLHMVAHVCFCWRLRAPSSQLVLGELRWASCRWTERGLLSAWLSRM
jgi:hypothetical protein